MPDPITHVLVPGTFDPITYGHVDVVRRARRICPRLPNRSVRTGWVQPSRSMSA